MKAAIIQRAGATPEYGEFPDPVTGDGYELVDLVAAGVHPVVRSLASGAHYGSTAAWPLIPGIDAVARTASGELIVTGFVKAPYGTFAERLAVPTWMRIALPDGADPVKIAAGLNPGLASWLPLNARLAEGGALATIVVVGVTGMAGMLAVQHARRLGATRIIGLGRNAAALRRAAALGAECVAITGDAAADAAALIDALRGADPDIVLDFLWGAPAETVFAALARSGMDAHAAETAYVQIGETAGADARVPASLLRSRRIRIFGSGVGSASLAEIMQQIPRYMQLIADGAIEIPTKTYPLSAIAEAWNAPTEAFRAVVVPLGQR